MNKNIQSFNDKDQRHGIWDKYWNDTGDLWYKAFFVNDKVSGYEEEHVASILILTFHL
jgi:hypothetical protein